MPSISASTTSARPPSRPCIAASTISCSPTGSRLRSPRRRNMADIAQRTVRMEPPQRPERMIELEAMGTVGDAARPLSFAERMLQITGVRRMIVVAVLCVAWQAYASYLNNSLLFPTLGETIDALYDALVSGPLIERTLTSMRTLLMGYGAGLALAGIFTTLAVSTRV